MPLEPKAGSVRVGAECRTAHPKVQLYLAQVAVARFIAAQRAEHEVPYATACRALGVSSAWYYKWRDGDASPRRARGEQLTVEFRGCSLCTAAATAPRGSLLTCRMRVGGSARTRSRRSWPSSGWSTMTGSAASSSGTELIFRRASPFRFLASDNVRLPKVSWLRWIMQ